jgi:phenylalanyl-tRNA synthetase alpha chain
VRDKAGWARYTFRLSFSKRWKLFEGSFPIVGSSEVVFFQGLESVMGSIESIKQEALAAISAASSAEAIEAVRIQYVSRKGTIPELMKQLKTLPPEDRKTFGQQVNDLKQSVESALTEKKTALEALPATDTAGIDVTLPGYWRELGSLHPITQLIERTTAIFRRLGFTVADGPDIETRCAEPPARAPGTR